MESRAIKWCQNSPHEPRSRLPAWFVRACGEGLRVSRLKSGNERNRLCRLQAAGSQSSASRASSSCTTAEGQRNQSVLHGGVMNRGVAIVNLNRSSSVRDPCQACEACVVGPPSDCPGCCHPWMRSAIAAEAEPRSASRCVFHGECCAI
jgi:hypothetical protein